MKEIQVDDLLHSAEAVNIHQVLKGHLRATLAAIVALFDDDIVGYLLLFIAITALDLEDFLANRELIFKATFLSEKHLQLRLEDEVKNASLRLLLRHLHVDLEVDLLLI